MTGNFGMRLFLFFNVFLFLPKKKKLRGCHSEVFVRPFENCSFGSHADEVLRLYLYIYGICIIQDLHLSRGCCNFKIAALAHRLMKHGSTLNTLSVSQIFPGARKVGRRKYYKSGKQRKIVFAFSFSISCVYCVSHSSHSLPGAQNSEEENIARARTKIVFGHEPEEHS